jgi:HPt (histidine-containing phosphotransfer) domain-containing protein
MAEPRAALDADAIDRLREAADGDEAFLHELVEEYLTEAPDQLATIERAVGSGATEEALRAAHTLKSTSATFGATALADLAREMEGLAREGRLDSLEGLAGQARTELGRVSALLRELELELGGEG